MSLELPIFTCLAQCWSHELDSSGHIFTGCETTPYDIARNQDTVPLAKVSGITAPNSVDLRLDEAAARALARWQFRPGTKGGDSVELEAVVQIPFRKHHPRP